MKYALIGCGRIATNHITAAKENKLEIVAVCDILPEAMEILLAKHNLQDDSSIKRYTDYKQMLAENDLDFVSIATESGKHAAIALYCIEHNLNLIIEKPIALSVKDADDIIRESDKRGLTVAVCHQNRFNLAIQQMREAVTAGRFGRISHASVNVRWNRNRNYYTQAPWRGTWEQDGGALMNQCIHGIDLLYWMMQDELEEVYGVTRQRFHSYLETEDLGMSILKFKSGAVASIEGTTNIFPNNLEETLCLFGESGTVRIGGTSCNNVDVWQFAEETDTDADIKKLTEVTSNVYGNGHARLFADFIDAVNNNRKPYVDARDGKKAMEIVLAIYKSQKTGLPVKLPLDDFSTLDMINEFGEAEK